jgi:aspartyl/asparaginyl beta-hydroxylase (cupin superfamily)
MTAATISESEIKRIVDAAERAAGSGLLAEAATLLQQAQVTAPDHPAVLAAIGMHALRSGDFTRARDALERAAQVDALNPMVWLNVAMARRAGRDVDAEMDALGKALALDPYFFLALLQKATLLERTGRGREAAAFYHAFLASVPPSAQASGSLQSAMAHARRAVDANSRVLENFLQEKLVGLRAKHSQDELGRANDCVDILTGRKRVYVQQPTFMHFPGLPAIQFYGHEHFDWLATLEAATDDIRRELLQLFADAATGFVPYIEQPEGTPLNQWKELNRSLQWSAFFLYREGAPVAENLARCPATAAVLARMPLADVPGHAPTAFLSILKPHTRIPPHTGVANTRLVVHLPLIVPAACGFRVGSETRAWQPGHAWVFDDTIEHEAWNDSEQVRAILIFDVWNPFLSNVEREVVRVATRAVGEFNQGVSPLAGAL